MISVEDWALIRRLVADGIPQRQVARQLGIGRSTVERALASDRPLGKFVGYVLDDEADRPAGPYATVVSAFEELERFVETRLRRE